MAVSVLTEEYVNHLRDCSPTIQENIVEAFNNEMARNHRRRDFIKTVHPLDPLLLQQPNAEIQLTELSLSWLPDFKVTTLDVNLPQLCLDIEFVLGDLTVEGSYRTNTTVLQNRLLGSTSGIISLNFKETKVRGRVGLLIEGDSFMARNYDVEYESTGCQVTLRYPVDKHLNTNIYDAPTDELIVREIWQQLKEILTDVLYDQLIEVVLNYSVQESLADQDAPLREFAQAQSTKANGLMDTLLCAAKDYILEKDLRSIQTSPFEVVYKGRPNTTENGQFKSGNGAVSDLATLTRESNLSLYDDGEQLLVYGSLTIRELKQIYEGFSTQFGLDALSGSLKAQVYKTKVFIKLSVAKQADEKFGKTKVEKLETRIFRDINIDTSGLGSLSWLIPYTKDWLIGHLRATGLSELLKRIGEAFSEGAASELKKSQQTNGEGDRSRQFWRSFFSKQ